MLNRSKITLIAGLLLLFVSTAPAFSAPTRPAQIFGGVASGVSTPTPRALTPGTSSYGMGGGLYSSTYLSSGYSRSISDSNISFATANNLRNPSGGSFGTNEELRNAIANFRSRQSAESTFSEKPTPKTTSGKRTFLTSLPDAEGDHSVFKKDNMGKITQIQEFNTPRDPRNPNKFEPGKRVDTQHSNPHAHYNKKTKKKIATPHAHDPNTPGGIRPARTDELPKEN